MGRTAARSGAPVPQDEEEATRRVERAAFRLLCADQAKRDGILPYREDGRNVLYYFGRLAEAVSAHPRGRRLLKEKFVRLASADFAKAHSEADVVECASDFAAYQMRYMNGRGPEGERDARWRRLESAVLALPNADDRVAAALAKVSSPYDGERPWTAGNSNARRGGDAKGKRSGNSGRVGRGASGGVRDGA